MPWKCPFCDRWNDNDNWDTCVQCAARNPKKGPDLKEEEEKDED